MIRFFLLLFLCSQVQASSLWYWDHEAANWNVRTVTNKAGGLAYVAATRFMNQHRAAGLRSSTLRANLCAGTALTNAMSPIIRDYGFTADLTVGSASPTYAQATGLTWGVLDAVTKTGLDPASTSMSSNSVGYMVYIGGATGREAASHGAALWGASGIETLGIAPAYTSVGEGGSAWRNAGQAFGAAETNGTGFFMVSRIGSATNSTIVYAQGRKTGESTSSGGTTFTTTGGAGLFYGANNAANTVQEKSAKNGMGYMLTLGWTEAQVQNSFRIWQRFQMTLGRNVAPY